MLKVIPKIYDLSDGVAPRGERPSGHFFFGQSPAGRRSSDLRLWLGSARTDALCERRRRVGPHSHRQSRAGLRSSDSGSAAAAAAFGSRTLAPRPGPSHARVRRVGPFFFAKVSTDSGSRAVRVGLFFSPESMAEDLPSSASIVGSGERAVCD